MAINDEPVRAIVFDFGGVFTQSSVTQERLRRYDEMLAQPPDTLQNALYSGEAWELASTGRISEEVYWEQAGRPYEDRLPADFRSFRRGLFWAEPIDEQVVALARRLHRDYPLALCSNALPELIDVLRNRPDVNALFDVKVISALVGLRKPDPAIFRLTAERLELPITACLLIDDKVRNTDAAQAVGMPAIIFESVPQLQAELAALGILPAGDESQGAT